jgi:hypothetical protein
MNLYYSNGKTNYEIIFAYQLRLNWLAQIPRFPIFSVFNRGRMFDELPKIWMFFECKWILMTGTIGVGVERMLGLFWSIDLFGSFLL